MPSRALVVIAVAVVAAACGGGEGGSDVTERGDRIPRPTLRGVVVLNSIEGDPRQAILRDDVSPTLCSGWANFGTGDIADGTSVVVRDAAGEIVGSSTLMAGEAVDLTSRPDPLTGGDIYSFRCELPFTIGKVSESRFYEITVGSRNPVVFKASDLKAQDWRAEITIIGS